jgi:hypothetical protein
MWSDVLKEQSSRGKRTTRDVFTGKIGYEATEVATKVSTKSKRRLPSLQEARANHGADFAQARPSRAKTNAVRSW